MPRTKSKKKPTTPRRSRKGYVMIEMNEQHRIALNWLLSEAEKLHGEKQQAAPFIRTLIWQKFAAEGGLEQLSESFFGGLDAVKTAPYSKGVETRTRDAEPRRRP